MFLLLVYCICVPVLLGVLLCYPFISILYSVPVLLGFAILLLVYCMVFLCYYVLLSFY